MSRLKHSSLKKSRQMGVAGLRPMTALRVNPARANRLLGSLPGYDRELRTPQLEPVELKFRQCLESASRKIQPVYVIDARLAAVVMPGVRRVAGRTASHERAGLVFMKR